MGLLLIKFKVLYHIIPVVFSAVVGEVEDLWGGEAEGEQVVSLSITYLDSQLKCLLERESGIRLRWATNATKTNQKKKQFSTEVPEQAVFGQISHDAPRALRWCCGLHSAAEPWAADPHSRKVPSLEPTSRALWRGTTAWTHPVMTMCWRELDYSTTDTEFIICGVTQWAKECNQGVFSTVLEKALITTKKKVISDVFLPWSWGEECVRPSVRRVCRCPWRPTRAASRAAAAGAPRSTRHPHPPGWSSTDRAGTPTPPAQADTHVNTMTGGTSTLLCGSLLKADK